MCEKLNGKKFVINLLYKQMLYSFREFKRNEFTIQIRGRFFYNENYIHISKKKKNGLNPKDKLEDSYH